VSWIRRSPFRDQAEAARRMIEILACEAARAGTPLTPEECETLVGEGTMSEELAARARVLIQRIFESEKATKSDPRNFGGSMEWASDGASSNIVELTYQVADGLQPLPRLRGWARVKDTVALVICGMVAVLLMCGAVIAAGYIFHWK